MDVATTCLIIIQRTVPKMMNPYAILIGSNCKSKPQLMEFDMDQLEKEKRILIGIMIGKNAYTNTLNSEKIVPLPPKPLPINQTKNVVNPIMNNTITG